MCVNRGVATDFLVGGGRIVGRVANLPQIP